MNFLFRYLKSNLIAVVCLALIVLSNFSIEMEIEKSSEALREKIDILENSMVVLNSDVDDSFLPQVFPEELWNEFGIPSQKERVDRKTFSASLVSQAERDIVASLSKISNNMLEIGTGKGGTTLIMAKYSAPKATVHTIDLPSESKAILYEQGDSPMFAAIAVESRTSKDYVYKKTKYKNKINQIFADTKNFDEAKLSKQC